VKKSEGEVKLLKKVIDRTWHHIASNKKTPIILEYASRPDKDGKPQPPALAPFSAIEFG